MFGQKYRWNKKRSGMDLSYDPVRFVLQYGRPYHILRMALFLNKHNIDTAPFLADLKSMQNEDGGWPWHWKEGKPSGMAETGRVMELLVNYGEDKTSPHIKKAFEFIISHQKYDGGWSENKQLQLIVPKKWYWISFKHSTVWITAAILRGLISAGHANNVFAIKGIEFLKRSQNTDGGWPSHVGSDCPFGSDLASMDDVVKVLLMAGYNHKSEIIMNLEKCTLSLRNQWKMLNFAGSALAILNALNYSGNTESVRDVIQILIDAQKIDGGWSGRKSAPSDPWYTTFCFENLYKYGVRYH